MRIRNTKTGQEFEVLPGTRVPAFYEIISEQVQKPVKTVKKHSLIKRQPEPTPEIEPETEPAEKPAEEPEKTPEKPAKKKKTSRKKKGAKNGK